MPMEQALEEEEQEQLHQEGTDAGEIVTREMAQIAARRGGGDAVGPDVEESEGEIGDHGTFEGDARRNDVLHPISVGQQHVGTQPEYQHIHSRPSQRGGQELEIAPDERTEKTTIHRNA